MNIVISDFLLEHKEELCDFVLNRFAEVVNLHEDSYFVCPNFKVTKIDDDLYTFDYRWIKRNEDPVFGTTQCFLYPQSNILHLLSFGNKPYIRSKYHKYVCDNIETFEKTLHRDKYIDSVL